MVLQQLAGAMDTSTVDKYGSGKGKGIKGESKGQNKTNDGQQCLLQLSKKSDTEPNTAGIETSKTTTHNRSISNTSNSTTTRPGERLLELLGPVVSGFDGLQELEAVGFALCALAASQDAWGTDSLKVTHASREMGVS